MLKNRWVIFAVVFVVFSFSLIYSSNYLIKPQKDEYVKDEEAKEERIKEQTTLLFRKEYKEDDFVKYFDEDDPPEMFNNFDFKGFKKEEMQNFLPDSWKVEEFSEEFVSLVYEGEKYVEDETEIESERYIGVYKDRIAIYEGEPPQGELIEVTPHEVKEVYEEELKEGIPYTTEEEREQILESYTS